jgi:hypothetical protein
MIHTGLSGRVPASIRRASANCFATDEMGPYWPNRGRRHAPGRSGWVSLASLRPGVRGCPGSCASSLRQSVAVCAPIVRTQNQPGCFRRHHLSRSGQHPGVCVESFRPQWKSSILDVGSTPFELVDNQFWHQQVDRSLFNGFSRSDVRCGWAGQRCLRNTLKPPKNWIASGASRSVVDHGHAGSVNGSCTEKRRRVGLPSLGSRAAQCTRGKVAVNIDYFPRSSPPGLTL